jgi:hypothetical protein
MKAYSDIPAMVCLRMQKAAVFFASGGNSGDYERRRLEDVPFGDDSQRMKVVMLFDASSCGFPSA